MYVNFLNVQAIDNLERHIILTFRPISFWWHDVVTRYFTLYSVFYTLLEKGNSALTLRNFGTLNIGMTGNNTLILGNCHINFTYFPHVPSFLPFAKQQIAMPSDDFLQILPFGARAWSNGCLLNAKKCGIEVETYFCCPHNRGVTPSLFS